MRITLCVYIAFMSAIYFLDNNIGREFIMGLTNSSPEDAAFEVGNFIRKVGKQ